MTSTEAPALKRTIPPSEFDIGTPVEWMVDPDRRETILGVTYAFSQTGERKTAWPPSVSGLASATARWRNEETRRLAPPGLICGVSARELILAVDQFRVFAFTSLRAAQEVDLFRDDLATVAVDPGGVGPLGVVDAAVDHHLHALFAVIGDGLAWTRPSDRRGREVARVKLVILVPPCVVRTSGD